MQANTSPATRPRISWTRWLPAPLVALAALAAGAAPAATPAGAPALPTYRVIQLSTVPDTYAGAINARGQVAFSEYDNGRYRARFYDGQQIRDLGTLGGPSAYAVAVNDLGQVAGVADVTPDGTVSHAFRWSVATGMVDITPAIKQNSITAAIDREGRVAGTLIGAGSNVFSHAFFWTPQTGPLDIGTLDVYSYATGSNDRGAVVGYSGGDGPFDILGFLWTRAGGIRNVGTLPDEFTLAADVNNLGHVVGATPFSTAPFPPVYYVHAFVWTPETGPIDLGTGTGDRSTAAAINDHDMVIGHVLDFPVLYHGFVWTRDMGLVEIGADRPDIQTFVGGLNNLGQVVGGYDTWAYLWTRSHGIVDLNTRLVGVPPGFTLTSAAAISDAGQIVAHANTGLVLLVPATAAAQAPVTGPIQSTGTPRANTALSFAAAVAGAAPGVVREAAWDWGDGATEAAAVDGTQGAASVNGQHVFRAPGIYAVKLTVTDKGGRRSTVGTKVIVSGTGPYLTGAGRFLSPPGASRSAPGRSGTATFSFLVPGAQDVASGRASAPREARVEFSAAGLSFLSARVDAPAVRDGQVQLRGSGAVDGKPGYRFLLTAAPGGAMGNGKATVRFRIWHEAPGTRADVVDYDNASDPRAASVDGAGSALQEGSVTIQSD
jgi:probable HAF family extracellular repeat protein